MFGFDVEKKRPERPDDLIGSVDLDRFEGVSYFPLPSLA